MFEYIARTAQQLIERHQRGQECDGGCGKTLFGYGLCDECYVGMRAAHTRALAAERCRPTEFPPYEPATAEGRHEALIWSPWVKRSLDCDLPTFDRHNGAYAYIAR